MAEIIGVHPNTVRLYEELKLIPQAERGKNGYRIFTEFHIAIFKLARLALQMEILQNGLRKKAVSMVKTAAARDFDTALLLTKEYLDMIQNEQENASEAIAIVNQILGDGPSSHSFKMKRKEAADYLQISMDTLRNWELNGLLTVKRKENGYRVYTDEDIARLKIIRSLRCANYSLESILRMLLELSANPEADIEKILNHRQANDETIVSVCDQLLISLKKAEHNAKAIQNLLYEIKNKY